MYAQVEKPKENKNRAVVSSVAQKKNERQAFGFENNRPEAIAQRQIQNMRHEPVARQQYVANQTQIIQRAWTTRGVNTVLDKDTAGRNTITNLNDQGYEVKKFSGGTYNRQYYHDSGRTVIDGGLEQRRVNGWHNRGPKLIAIKNEHDKNLAASTLVHEVSHANQHQANEDDLGIGVAPYPDKKSKEYDAHIRQDYFNKAAGIPPKKPEFRNKDGSVNEDNIKAYVDRVYAVGAQARYYRNFPIVYNTIETIKPWPAISRATPMKMPTVGVPSAERLQEDMGKARSYDFQKSSDIQNK